MILKSISAIWRDRGLRRGAAGHRWTAASCGASCAPAARCGLGWAGQGGWSRLPAASFQRDICKQWMSWTKHL